MMLVVFVMSIALLATSAVAQSSSGGGGGGVMSTSTCYLNVTQDECIATPGCRWDMWGQFCQPLGCWDFWDAGSCAGNATDLGIACTWETAGGAGSGWCEDAAGCWNYHDSSACTGAGCTWDGSAYCGQIDCWSFNDQYNCEANACTWDGWSCMEASGCWEHHDNASCTTGGCNWKSDAWCEMAGCWNHMNEDDCNGGIGCQWMSDEWGSWCMETGGCFEYSSSGETVCEDNGCVWDEGMSNCMMADCWAFDDNETECTVAAANDYDLSCSWSLECHPNDPSDSDCGQHANSDDCTNAGCGWGSCMMQGCWDYNQSACEATSSCYWDSQYNECYEEGCWSYEEADCTPDNGCNWKSDNGWCEDSGCWNHESNASCQLASGCDWEEDTNGNYGWCYEIGCWDYSDVDTCYLYNSTCAWDDSGSYCYEKGCWDNENAGNCTGDCDWIDTGQCSEEGCWENTLEGDCTTAGCTWEGGGWCEDTGCWNYKLKSTCDNVDGCTWNEQYSYCEQKSCGTFATEGQCNAYNITSSSGVLNCFWDGWSCMELGCWNLNNQGNCSDAVGTALGCSWNSQSECKEQNCWNWNTEGDCMADSDCNWTGSCYGDYSLECWNHNTEGACLSGGCTWEGNCNEKGCWSYNTQTECCGSSDCTAGELCGWESSGWCKDTGCWDYYNEANCTGTAGCIWDGTSNYCYEEGCWDYNQSTCTLNAYRDCKWGGNVTDGYCYEEGCWNWMTSAQCGAHNSSNCVWDTNGQYCYEEGCWSKGDSASCNAQSNCEWENQGWCFSLGCWNYNTEGDCTDSDACAWDSTYDYCYEKGCWDYSENSSCQNNTKCDWEGDENGYCFEAGCWNNYDAGNCTENSNCFWDTSNTAGWCQQGGCWDFYNTDDCANATENSSLNCQWDSQWGNCIEQGCWAYQNDTNCAGGTNCNWNTGFGWCYEEGCWDIYEEGLCTANSKCDWNSDWDYCYEKGCWDKDQGGCEGNASCRWQQDEWGWCEEVRCWNMFNETDCNGTSNTLGLSCLWNNNWNVCEEAACWAFDGNEANCNNSGIAWTVHELNCTFQDDRWCEPNAGTCDQYTNNEKGCMDTFYCFWDWQTNECKAPTDFGGQGFAEEMEAFNPECWLFDTNWTACHYDVSICEYDNATNSCDNKGANTGEPVQCENITNRNLCTEITALSNCCKWRDNNCTTDYADKSCHDNMKEPPEGGMFCEDWKSYTNEDVCNQIMGSPWFMPCTWDGEHCTFKFDDVVGTGGDFFDIKTKNMCEQAGGEWLCENYCDDNGTAVVDDDVLRSECWCQAGKSKSNCMKSCWACDYNGTASWPDSVTAEGACEDSKANCEFTVNTNAANGFGTCDFATATQTGGGCDKSCTACNDIVDDLQTKDPETKMACLQSQAACKWAQDLANLSQGKCMGQSGKTCSQSCFACTEAECEGYGLQSAGACNWDDQESFCEPVNFDNEICFNEKDDDNDGEIDCNDPDCFFMPECAEGEGMHECWKFLNESTCIPGWGNLTDSTPINCTWIQDPWGASWCGHPAESCWQLDNDATACDAQDGCRYKSTGGFCDINKSMADACFGKAQAGCVGDCTWITDYNNPKGGFCEYKMFALCHDWSITSQSQCESTTNLQYCAWKQDQYAPNGGWCEPKCFVLDNTSCAANIKCDWLAGFCEPDMTRGEDCFSYDNNQSGCQDQPACLWHEPDFMMGAGSNCEPADGGVFAPTNCMDTYWEEGECNADSDCYWMEDPFMGGGVCENKAFACFEIAWKAFDEVYNGTNHAVAAAVANDSCAAANASGCIWISKDGSPMGGECMPVCMYNATMWEMGGQDPGTGQACTAMDGCQEFSGWCDPKSAGMMGMKMDTPPTDIGFDQCPEGDNAGYQDICVMGVKDDFDMLGIGVAVESLNDAAVCNGQWIMNMSTMFMDEVSMTEGSGEQPLKLAFYIDSDGINSGGCSAGSTQVGYDLKIVLSSTMAEKTKVTPYKCVTGSWESSSIQASTLASIICSKSGPMVMIDKGTLFDTGMFDLSYDLRILAVMMNVTSGTTIDSVSGIYTPGALDFLKEDCMGFADMDGDGLLPDQDPDCKFIKQFGGNVFEDCHNGIDDDQDGLADCLDPNCAFLPHCGGSIFDFTADADDTTMPTISTYEVKKFVDAAFVTYTSSELANGTLTFYGTSSGCSVKNATVHDVGVTNANVPAYRMHHDGVLDTQTLGLHNLTNGTTYFFKLKVCDRAGNPCAESACINFTTEIDMTACGVNCEPVFDVKFTPPSGDSYLSSVDIQWDFGQGFQQKGCGGAAAVKKTYNETKNLGLKIGNDNASWSMQMGGIDVQGQIDTNKTSIESDELFANQTPGGINYVGMDHDRWDEIYDELLPEYIDLCVPGGHTNLYYCANESAVSTSACTDVTNMIIGEPVYNSTLGCTMFRVPSDLGFSVYFGYVVGDDDDDDDSSPGSPGGGGAPAAVSNSTSKKWSTLAAEVEQRMKVYNAEFGIKEIYFTTTEDLSNVEMKVTNLGLGKPADVIAGPGGEVYRYFDITKSMITDDQITSVKMRFQVQTAWLDALGLPANVRLYRYSKNRWVELSTVYTDTDDTYYFFNATSPGMSYFAIGLTGDAVAPVEEPTEPVEPVEPGIDDPTGEVVAPLEPVEPIEPDEDGTSVVVVLLVTLLVVLIIAGAGYFYWTKQGEDK